MGLSARGIFLPATAFAAFASAGSRLRSVWGLDYPFTLAFAGEAIALGAARLVSTPSLRPFGRSAWLGIACYRFPRIWAVLLLRFPGGHSMCGLSPLRLPISPRPLYRAL